MLASQGSAQAQYLVVQALRVCPSEQAAIAEARQNTDLALHSFDVVRFAHPNSETACKLVTVELPVDYEQHVVSSIAPHRAWAITYDKTSSLAFRSPAAEGREVRYAYRIQTVRYYHVVFRGVDGNTYRGWLEVPARPYMLDWARDNGLSPLAKP
jgi:hypothetical protein